MSPDAYNSQLLSDVRYRATYYLPPIHVLVDHISQEPLLLTHRIFPRFSINRYIVDKFLTKCIYTGCSCNIFIRERPVSLYVPFWKEPVVGGILEQPQYTHDRLTAGSLGILSVLYVVIPNPRPDATLSEIQQDA
jgi:hypothetical protein